MADRVKNTVKSWSEGVAKKAGGAAKRVTKATTDAAGSMSEKLKNSDLKDRVSDAGSWTKEQFHRSGVGAATKVVTQTTSDVLDTVSGQKILDLMEERNALQDKYNDILATKLEDALRRIELLEKVFTKVPS